LPSEVLTWLVGAVTVVVPIVLVFNHLFSRLRKCEDEVNYLRGILGQERANKGKALARKAVAEAYREGPPAPTSTANLEGGE
jgi:hypothetical protein